MRTKKAIVLTMALLVTSGLLIGCGASSGLRIGWVASGGPRQISARYRTFNGVERRSFRVEANQAVEIDYDVTVEKGTLTLSVIDPDGETVWEETFEETDGDGEEPSGSFSGEHQLGPVPRAGRYRLRIEGQRTGGRFDISWQVKGPQGASGSGTGGSLCDLMLPADL